MTVPAHRPVLVPAVILYFALAAASPSTSAGEEPVLPFPGTSVPGAVEDGMEQSAEASPRPSGVAAAGSAAGRGGPGAADGDDTAASDTGAEVPGAAGPAVDAETSDAAVSEDTIAAARSAAPAGGSRLLRALAELPETPAPGDAARPGTPRVPGTSVFRTSVFAAEGCPRALLRRLVAGAAGGADALSALGIEREILILCRERQEILAGLFEAEARLSELREAGRAPEQRAPVMAASTSPALRVGAPGGATAVETAAPSPLRAALGGAAETLVPETLVPETADEADPRALEPQHAARVSPRYAWFSIIGTAGALRAGVTDGTGVWFVREGDPLPGGATVAAIAGRPPGVRVTVAGETLVPETLVPGSGEAVLLPFGARPGGGP